MWKHKVIIIAYFLTFLTTNRNVEGAPSAMEYLVQIKQAVVKRMRRNAINFHTAIRCYQPSIIVLGTYGDYGCYCGLNGKSDYAAKALDETDECCMRHDKCYDEAGNVEKSMWESLWFNNHLLQRYENNCLDGKVICATNSPYQDKLCNCDKEAAKCFYEASARYRPQLFNIDVNLYCKSNSSLDGLNMTYFENRLDKVKDAKPVSDQQESMEAKEKEMDENRYKQLTTDNTNTGVYTKTNATTLSPIVDRNKQNESPDTAQSNKNKVAKKMEEKANSTANLFILTTPATQTELKHPSRKPVIKTKHLPPVIEKNDPARLRHHSKTPTNESNHRVMQLLKSTPSGRANTWEHNASLVICVFLFAAMWNSYAT